ncbi:hypothetical protein A9Q84_00700 [Halobacteriovorax marinus]|uniref:Uncharacterized protein n=1 Tax=Halobacteriovorax marinus TaxID=97084 RepID=A0A1Y5FBI7_9BACT|nr:hypothetical protein A9Q84_00700 [Halobacteriovorax marinus]
MVSLIFLTWFSLSLGAKEVVICADNWCPYNCEPSSSNPGFMVEIVRESFRLFGSGEKVVYKLLPWTRAMKEARAGTIDGIIGAIDSESVGLHTPSLEQGMMSAQFFTHSKKMWKFSNTSQLKNSKKRVGAVKGYDFDSHIAKFFKENPAQIQYSHGEEALPKLINILRHQRIDTIIEDQAVFWNKVKELKISKNTFRSAGPVGPTKKLYVAFHNKSHAKIVAKGMVALRKSGELKKILKKYNLVDWK